MITGKARLAGVAGWPVAHSRSPVIHNYWLAGHGLDGAYLPLPVAPDDFPAAVAALRRMGFRGINVTVPHKEAAHAIATRLDEAASQAGAVNTLVFREDGEIEGLNTDGVGFMASLDEQASGWQSIALCSYWGLAAARVPSSRPCCAVACPGSCWQTARPNAPSAWQPRLVAGSRSSPGPKTGSIARMQACWSTPRRAG